MVSPKDRVTGCTVGSADAIQPLYLILPYAITSFISEDGGIMPTTKVCLHHNFCHSGAPNSDSFLLHTIRLVNSSPIWHFRSPCHSL